MTVQVHNPRVVLISQWPNVKNAEYELIEKIRQTGFKISVVDYLGFDVESGQCINNENLGENYDFAISFHYDTPKFLNIPTFLWVANPLEYMHLRGDYRHFLLNQLRAYDDYLYNGSNILQEHIKRVVGSEWQNTQLSFFASCSQKVMLLPNGINKEKNNKQYKIFYCGINWERGSDKSGRAQGLLDILQEKQVADFYGPRMLEGINPWEGFSSYQGEIPFDGVSMSHTMQTYGAVLAVSSPAHIKSRTSSSRVFEGIAAGVPVISDENAHVRLLFGDLVYYFSGATEADRAESIMTALKEITENPQEARRRVLLAQEKIKQYYSFEHCLTQLLSFQNSKKIIAVNQQHNIKIDVFLFSHQPYDRQQTSGLSFPNLGYVIKAAQYAYQFHNAKVRFFYHDIDSQVLSKQSYSGIELVSLTDNIKFDDWHKLRLGEKLRKLRELATGDLAVFLTQDDYPHYDYFEKPLTKFYDKDLATANQLYIAGFFVNDLLKKAPPSAHGLLRNNSSVGLYRWTQNSLAEHQLGQIIFTSYHLRSIDVERLGRFDVLLPIVIILQLMANSIPIYRSRHITLRVKENYFQQHYDVYKLAVTKGFWAQHYELLSNYTHELNALYDCFHEYPTCIKIIDSISGHEAANNIPVDPAIYRVNQLINRLRPIYQILRKVKHFLIFKKIA